MKVKLHFFGKDCIIERNLLDRSDVGTKLGKYGITYDHLLFMNQVHSPEVVVIDDIRKIYDKTNLPKADALVTNLKNVALGLFTADCAPVLFFDEEHGVIAAMHAGWRGARTGVIKSTVVEMKKLGAKKIEALIGPMIQQRSYEISEEFFADFLSEDSDNEKFFIDHRPGHYLFDLPSYVEKKIQAEGVAEVKNSRIDTFESGADFFSFRRSRQKGEEDCGRNVSIIVIN